MQKPTGRTGKNGDRIHQCMLIEKKIWRKLIWGWLAFRQIQTVWRAMTVMRIRGGGAAKGAGRNDVSDALDLDLEYDNEGNQIIVPSLPPPIRCSPPRSIPVATTVN